MTDAARETGAPTTARNTVVAAALDLFVAQGFESTSVEQIAQAAGVSRSTFFRQFGGKDDVVFSDHDVLLAQLREFLNQARRDPRDNPWAAACAAPLMSSEPDHHAQPRRARHPSRCSVISPLSPSWPVAATPSSARCRHCASARSARPSPGRAAR